MANTPDYTKMVQDMMGAFPMDMSAMEGMMKSSADMGEKFSKVAIDAADKSTELSTKWTKDTLAKMGDITTAKKDPADYTKAMTDFASTQAEAAAEYMSAFAEVAKKVQMDTVELMLAAGKDMGDEASAAVKKATDEVTKATKKAAKA
ncbi:phasin family protein [Maritimibacter dapengensis]|uniref:Phasin family protein n=1 Tax=Maritimibacter dapengensis TaxID=2836868 RepID=A0ABS6T0Z3_9RHOB|nr:phasin family protein [Maritimibacter dapengensis]MBV7378236.1 phasin family protein [Maritimibacter dapengensis]